MKKIITLVLALLAVMVFASGKGVDAAETTLKPYAPYTENFERFEAETHQDVVYGDTVFGFDAHGSGVIVDVEGDKQLKYTVSGVDGGFSRLGSLGTNRTNFLDKLVAGEKYHFSMYLNLGNVTAGSTLWIEYQSNEWVGTRIVDGVAYPCQEGQIFNLSYVNNMLEFDFIAHTVDMGTSKGYVKLTGQGMSVNDVIYMDDLAISVSTKSAVLSMDYEDKVAGTNAHDTPNHWLGYGQSISYEEENGNKFLHVVNTSAGQDWPAFYFNGLPVVSGTKYRLELDILSGNFERLYVCYPDSGNEEYEYSRDGFIQAVQASTPALGATTFDGSHLSVEFTPSTSYGNWWAQIKIVLYHNGGTLDVKIDNVKIVPASAPTSAKELTTNVTEKQLKLGEELDLSDLEVSLVRTNGDTRVLANDEYILDLSQEITTISYSIYRHNNNSSICISRPSSTNISCGNNHSVHHCSYLLSFSVVLSYELIIPYDF